MSKLDDALAKVDSLRADSVSVRDRADRIDAARRADASLKNIDELRNLLQKTAASGNESSPEYKKGFKLYHNRDAPANAPSQQDIDDAIAELKFRGVGKD